MKKIVLAVLVFACLFGCKSEKNKGDGGTATNNVQKPFVMQGVILEEEEEEKWDDSMKGNYLRSLDPEVRDNSLVSWITDSAFYANPRLMMLLDTLCLHVYDESYPSEIRKEEKWMTDFRKKLCAYYDSHPQWNHSISPFAKADSVLNEGSRLTEKYSTWTTMEMIMITGSGMVFNECREYGLLTQLVSHCKKKGAKELVYNEMAIFNKMYKKIGLAVSNIVGFAAGGGSVASVISCSCHSQICDAHREFYQSIINAVNGRKGKRTGKSINEAEQLLFTSCKKSLEKSVSIEMSLIEEGLGDDSALDETVKETEKAIQELKPLIKEWKGIINKLDNEISSDGSVKRAASNMLVEWANIIKECSEMEE